MELVGARNRGMGDYSLVEDQTQMDWVWLLLLVSWSVILMVKLYMYMTPMRSKMEELLLVKAMPRIPMKEVRIPFIVDFREAPSGVECAVSSEVALKCVSFCQPTGVENITIPEVVNTSQLLPGDSRVHMELPILRDSYLVVLFINRDVTSTPDEVAGLLCVLQVSDGVFSKVSGRILHLADGRFLHLRELFLTSSESGDKPRCVICLEGSPSRVFLPCRHVCVCRSCFSRLQACPLCRGPIYSYFSIKPY